MFRRIKNIFHPSVYYLPTKPIGRWFGFERGTPIDRYYINKFLEKNRQDIKGNVAEISERTYTQYFSSGTVNKSYVLNPSHPPKNFDPFLKYGCNNFQKIKNKFTPPTTIEINNADLTTGKNLPHDIDCFICTQTLMCIFDLNKAIINSLKMIKSGGVILVTVSGISKISRYDFNRWGYYQYFTDLGLKKYFEQFLPPKNISVKTYGNVKTATAFLYGIAAQELTLKDLDSHDQDFPVTITARIKKS